MSEQILVSRNAAHSPAQRFLAIETPLGPGAITLLSLDGEDVLSRCFLYRVAIVTGETDAAVESLLGMPVTLWLMNNDPDRRRPIHGHVRRIVGLGRDSHGNREYRLEVVPRLWFLSCTADCRIFQNQSVPDILRTVFQDQGLTDFEFRVVQEDYRPLVYCVQYRESALDFVSRLMEHLGLFYWHEHSAKKHLLVIGDRNAATPMCDPDTASVSKYDEMDRLRTFDIDCSFRPGKWTLNDYDFESPTKQLLVGTPTVLTVPRMKDHEIYEYPGDFRDQDTGRLLSLLRVEMEEAHHLRVFGTGRCVGFDPGRRVTVAGAPGEQGTTYLLTEVRHHATSPGLDAQDRISTIYSNEFVAIRADLPFRPERLTLKPFVRGTQTATVVGPAGENIHCDPYGRVRVQFHWDRRGKRNDQSSCWLRVAQSRSGANYGTLAIPHVGHEVLITFIEGDPDRPLIIGTVPNALTMPPVVLPDDKNKTVQRDHGNNKFVMQGKAGKESLSMVSPRAVNLFASGRTARPLSSASVPGSQVFSVSPSQNNAATPTSQAPATTGTATDASGNQYSVSIPSSFAAGVPGAQTMTAGGATYTIPNYQDATGLKELWAEWYGTVMSDIDDSGNTSATAGTYGEQDGAITGSYLNWGSEGKINCLVLDNNNLWVYGNGNTWINGQVFSMIKGGSDVLIEKYSATTVLGENNTTVSGGNTTEVGGVNLAVTLGANIAWNMVEVFTWNLAFTQTVNVFEMDVTGDKIELIGQQVLTAGQDIKNLGVEIKSAGSKIDDIGVKILDVQFEIMQSQLNITNTDTALNDSGITVFI